MIILDHIDGLGVVILDNLINESEVKYFLYRIEKNFPNFVAGIITDRHGFPVASKISNKLWILENTLALSAITKNKVFKEDSKLVQIKRDLDKSKNYKLLILLQKSKEYKSRLKPLKSLIKSQDLF
ncbi:MAG: hypothetical protein KAV01_06805 [Candidatus Lokiarchaeota archaeon]|nr:hypothetical protein [Candidatus Lokiarchaeota archaeon]MCK4480219.1 hypothetical protein [Candidatus Lokiarchaeota archaeon]